VGRSLSTGAARPAYRECSQTCFSLGITDRHLSDSSEIDARCPESVRRVLLASGVPNLEHPKSTFWRTPMNQTVPVFVPFVLVAALVNTAFPPEGGVKPKKTEVEGSWKLAKGGKGVPKQITFSGNKFVLTFAEDRVLKGTFKLNTKENPSWMDMTILSDSVEKYTGKVTLCI
jgi:hypothetical protein